MIEIETERLESTVDKPGGYRMRVKRNNVLLLTLKTETELAAATMVAAFLRTREIE